MSLFLNRNMFHSKKISISFCLHIMDKSIINKNIFRYRNKVILCVFLILNSLKAQDDIDRFELLVSNKDNTTSFFHLYDPPFVVKAIYNDTLEAVNRYPEQLMHSIISADTQAWVDYNVMGGKEFSEKKKASHFESVKSMDKNRNYFELLHKQTFMMDGLLTAIIKFKVFTQDKNNQSIGVTLMQKKNHRWYRISSKKNDILFLLLHLRFESKKLKDLLLGKSEDVITYALYNKINNNGTIDFNLLQEEFKNWYNPTNPNKKMLNYFIDDTSW